jgi:hypothetical protein
MQYADHVLAYFKPIKARQLGHFQNYTFEDDMQPTVVVVQHKPNQKEEEEKEQRREANGVVVTGGTASTLYDPKRDRLTLADYQHAYRTVSAIPLLRSAIVTDFLLHRCTAQCPFHYFQKGLMVCRASLHWHQCTVDTCDRLVQNHEGETCELTGTVYYTELNNSIPADFTGDFNTTSNATSNTREFAVVSDIHAASAASAAPAVAAAVDPKRKIGNKRLLQLLEKYQCIDISSPPVLEGPPKKKAKTSMASARRIPARKRAAVCDEIFKLQMKAMQVVRDVFRANQDGVDPVQVFHSRQRRRTKRSAAAAAAAAAVVPAVSPVLPAFMPDDDQQQVMAKQCIQQWTDVTRTKLYATHKQRYGFEYHVLVILNEMVHGFSVYHPTRGETVVIERNEVVHRCLQQRRDLLVQNQKYGWTPKQLTNSSKLYHMFVRELYL